MLRSDKREMVLTLEDPTLIKPVYKYACKIDHGEVVEGSVHYLFLPYIMGPDIAIQLVANMKRAG